MAFNTKKRGADFTISRNGGSFASPSGLIPISTAKDIKLNLAPSALFDSSNRAIAVETEIPTRIKCSVDFNAIWDGSAGLTALRTAFLALTPIELLVLDGLPAAAAWGVNAEWAVTNFALEFPLKDGQPLKITLQPHGNFTPANLPAFVSGTYTAGTAETPATKKLGTDGSINISDGTPIGSMMDVKLTLVPGALFTSDDRSTSFDTVIPTRFKYSAEGSFIWNSGDTSLVAIRDAFVAGTPIELFVLDGAYATTGSWGVHSDWSVQDFSMTAPLKDGTKVDCKFGIHGNYSNVPTIVTIS